jgi:hypothetical protein
MWAVKRYLATSSQMRTATAATVRPTMDPTRADTAIVPLDGLRPERTEEVASGQLWRSWALDIVGAGAVGPGTSYDGWVPSRAAERAGPISWLCHKLSAYRSISKSSSRGRFPGSRSRVQPRPMNYRGPPPFGVPTPPFVCWNRRFSPQLEHSDRKNDWASSVGSSVSVCWRSAGFSAAGDDQRHGSTCRWTRRPAQPATPSRR